MELEMCGGERGGLRHRVRHHLHSEQFSSEILSFKVFPHSKNNITFSVCRSASSINLAKVYFHSPTIDEGIGTSSFRTEPRLEPHS